MPFDATSREQAVIPISFQNYLKLIDQTGRDVRPDKRGAISNRIPNRLQASAADVADSPACGGIAVTLIAKSLGKPA